MIFGPYPARVVEVYDGDTIVLDIDLGFDHLISGKDWNGKTRLSCRIWGINAPELRTPEGKTSQAYAAGLLPSGSLCQVLSHGWDKYGGRFDGQIEIATGDFGSLMIAAGQAVAV